MGNLKENSLQCYLLIKPLKPEGRVAVGERVRRTLCMETVIC